MNSHKRSVLSYIEHRNCEPLIFKDFFEKEIKIDSGDSLPLNDLVMSIIKGQKNYLSYCGEIFETNKDKWRSSLDIWRHVIYYQPDKTIFDVMNSLFELKSELVGHYCMNIHRRVFKSKHIENDLEENHYCLSISTYDEYELYFKDWEKINE